MTLSRPCILTFWNQQKLSVKIIQGDLHRYREKIEVDNSLSSVNVAVGRGRSDRSCAFLWVNDSAACNELTCRVLRKSVHRWRLLHFPSLVKFQGRDERCWCFENCGQCQSSRKEVCRFVQLCPTQSSWVNDSAAAWLLSKVHGGGGGGGGGDPQQHKVQENLGRNNQEVQVSLSPVRRFFFKKIHVPG